MISRPKSKEPNSAGLVALSKEEERQADSPLGLLATAAELRRRAAEMEDSNDSDTMLRVAAGYEQRAGRR